MSRTSSEVIDAQKGGLAYPEGAWVGSCGHLFPSRVQWLHKYLTKVDDLDLRPKVSEKIRINSEDNISIGNRTIPNLSTTSTKVMKMRATVGSGLTTQGIVIHEQVSLDWIKWALGRKVWKTLYTQERMNGSVKNTELILNDVKDVLNFAVEEGMLLEYRITEINFDRYKNNLSLKFSCKLLETILFVDISGSLYY